MLGRGRWVGNPLRVAAASCIAAALSFARPQPCAAQTLNLASSRPQWGANAAIEADLLGDSSGRETNRKKALRVLLVGNSYTKFNLLHMLLAKVADGASGPRLHVDVEARGGYSLRMHLKSRTALIKIKNGHYSHVVLQGHSLSAVDHPDELAEDAERFNAAIAASGSRTVLYETWARKPNTSLYRKHSFVRTFDDMVRRIDTTYLGIARRLHVELAPVGGAFVRAFRSEPGVQLWGSDGSHPTLAGSYLAACVLYGAITGRDPRESTYVPFPLDARLGANIRAVAAASLNEVPDWPAGELAPSTLVASGGGSSGQDASKPGRPLASAKVRGGAKPREVSPGHVAASIAALLGRAPGETEAPMAVAPVADADEDDADSAAQAEHAAHLDVADPDAPTLLSAPVRDVPAEPAAPAFLDDFVGPAASGDNAARIF
jgi:hypothetical protein